MKKTVYIGDSAHSFHPIAGQGWNLGMQDLESLYNLVKKYNSLGLELGDDIFCKEFQKNNFSRRIDYIKSPIKLIVSLN